MKDELLVKTFSRKWFKLTPSSVQICFKESSNNKVGGGDNFCAEKRFSNFLITVIF